VSGESSEKTYTDQQPQHQHQIPYSNKVSYFHTNPARPYAVISFILMAAFSRGAQITGQFADNRYRPFDDRHFYFISFVITSLHYYKFMTHKLKLILIPSERMGKCFSVVRRQDSGTVRAGPNRILEFPCGCNLFILHRPVNTGMDWAGP